MNISGVYQIKNLMNGKVYVGSSINFKKRLIRHKSQLRNNKHDNKYLQRSYNKYGIKCFDFSLLESCEKINLIATEQKWIDSLNSYNAGYNLRPIANNNHGWHHTCESKVKLSVALAGRKLSDSHKLSLSIALTGKIVLPSTRAKLSAANMGKIASIETREKLSIALSLRNKGNTYRKGIPMSNHTKAMLIKANKGRVQSDDHKAKNSLAHKGKIASKETRDKMSASAMGHSCSMETRAKLSLANKGKSISDNQKAIAKENAIKQFITPISREIHSSLMKAYYADNPQPRISRIRANVGLATSWARRKGIPFSPVKY